MHLPTLRQAALIPGLALSVFLALGAGCYQVPVTGRTALNTVSDEAVNQMSGECVADAEGAVLRITVEDSPYKDLLKAYLTSNQVAPGWGLHRLDVPLVLGDLLEVTATESKAWLAHH